MARSRFFLAGLCLLFASLAQAASNAAGGADQLQGFYNKVHTLSAHFEQVQRDSDGNTVQQAAGTFLLSRPDKFRWQYDSPYKQVIVSNGKAFKFYDVDLAQVTIRDIGQTLKATPAALLTGGTALSDAFNITAGGTHGGMRWVHLTPRSRDTDFKSVELGFKNQVPAVMELHDNLGQVTHITFSHVKVNPHLDADRFKLKIPKGVEVVDGRARAQSRRNAQ